MECDSNTLTCKCIAVSEGPFNPLQLTESDFDNGEIVTCVPYAGSNKYYTNITLDSQKKLFLETVSLDSGTDNCDSDIRMAYTDSYTPITGAILFDFQNATALEPNSETQNSKYHAFAFTNSGNDNCLVKIKLV